MLFHSPPFLSRMERYLGAMSKNRVRPYYNGYMTGGAPSYVGLGSGSSDHISLKWYAGVLTNGFISKVTVTVNT